MTTPYPHAAHLTLTGILEPTNHHRHALIHLPSGERLACKLRAFRRNHLTPALDNVPLEVHLWPRTDHNANLTSHSQLFRFKPATRLQADFTITGRLIMRKAAEKRAVVLIRRNYTGNLAREFPIEVALTDDVFSRVPKPLPPGVHDCSGIQFTGVLQKGQLLATGVELVSLQPPKASRKRPDAPPAAMGAW